MTRSRDFEDWYPNQHRRLLASLVVLCGDRDIAQDAAAEALARALQHWSRVSMMESPEGWVYRVAVNRDAPDRSSPSR